jgi:hypothetical protein
VGVVWCEKLKGYGWVGLTWLGMGLVKGVNGVGVTG